MKRFASRTGDSGFLSCFVFALAVERVIPRVVLHSRLRQYCDESVCRGQRHLIERTAFTSLACCRGSNSRVSPARKGVCQPRFGTQNQEGWNGLALIVSTV